MFKEGVYTVLITPFFKNDNIDFDSLKNLVIKQSNDNNIEGIVLLGTTSEQPTLNYDMKKAIVKFVHVHNAGKKKLIIGVLLINGHQSASG